MYINISQGRTIEAKMEGWSTIRAKAEQNLNWLGKCYDFPEEKSNWGVP